MEFTDWISLASAVIAVVSMIVTVWVPLHRKSEANWTLLRNFIPEGSQLSEAIYGLSDVLSTRDLAEPDYIFELVNTGDGDAFNVKVSSKGCSALMYGRYRACEPESSVGEMSVRGFMGNGDSVYILIWDTPNASSTKSLDIHWVTPPTRLNQHLLSNFVLQGEETPLPAQPLRERDQNGYVPAFLYHFEHSKPLLWLYRSTLGLFLLHHVPWSWTSLRKKEAKDLLQKPGASSQRH
ncbi:MAG: hypothetical protein SOH95_05390 [Bifidobacterium crudilactis]|jgi:hypothetical protein